METVTDHLMSSGYLKSLQRLVAPRQILNIPDKLSPAGTIPLSQKSAWQIGFVSQV
ncbi:MAG: hypothetical protein AAFO76_01555 [Cyanobacteria bacterium J06607_15]